MRSKEAGYFIEALIFIFIGIIGLIDESTWIVTTGILLAAFICTVLANGSRKVFRTRISYFYPIILFAVVGIVLILIGVVRNNLVDGLAYIIFGIFFAFGAIVTAPTFLIYDDRFIVKEKTGE